MDNSDKNPNPPFVIGKGERQSSMGDLYEHHKNSGTMGLFYDVYPELKPREPVTYGPER